MKQINYFTKLNLRQVLTGCLLLNAIMVYGQSTWAEVPVIPKPNMVERSEGQFTITNQTALVFGGPEVLQECVQFFQYFSESYSYVPPQIPEAMGAKNYIQLHEADWGEADAEKYELEINPQEVIIHARKGGAGFAYGLNTLFQLIRGYNVPDAGKNMQELTLPCMKISDKPRYAWRGMHLDVSRHFFDITFIKRYLSLMALYKLNTFHWHLTDDQGWRIEIKKYPGLIRHAAWRTGSMIGKYSDNKYEEIRHGGFYTHEQIKDVVNFAAMLHITIVPEIEMPGHSVAAISAYPYLSCTGKQIQVARGWGVFNDVFCTKDTTFRFLTDVLSEVMELFPSRYIHIGGDECPKVNWKKCPRCQKRKNALGLKNEEQLQSYFIRRIEKFVNSKGRQIIGWDEILEGGLAPNASVMSWRGTEGGIKAAKMKHNVVMSPGKPCYFDHYQSKDTLEPLAIGGYNPLDSVYAYDPTPLQLSVADQKYILGAQGNVWTEYMISERQVEYMVFPRMAAMAEVVWTQKSNKDYGGFLKRLEKNRFMLDKMYVNYARHFLNEKKE